MWKPRLRFRTRRGCVGTNTISHKVETIHLFTSWWMKTKMWCNSYSGIIFSPKNIKYWFMRQGGWTLWSKVSQIWEVTQYDSIYVKRAEEVNPQNENNYWLPGITRREGWSDENILKDSGDGRRTLNILKSTESYPLKKDKFYDMWIIFQKKKNHGWGKGRPKHKNSTHVKNTSTR